MLLKHVPLLLLNHDLIRLNIAYTYRGYTVLCNTNDQQGILPRYQITHRSTLSWSTHFKTNNSCSISKEQHILEIWKDEWLWVLQEYPGSVTSTNKNVPFYINFIFHFSHKHKSETYWNIQILVWSWFNCPTISQFWNLF